MIRLTLTIRRCIYQIALGNTTMHRGVYPDSNTMRRRGCVAISMDGELSCSKMQLLMRGVLRPAGRRDGCC